MTNAGIRMTIGLLLACQLLSGCSKAPAKDGRIMARAGNNYITVSDFNDRIASMPPYYREAIEKNKRRYLDEMIAEKLFYEEAVRRGLNNDAEVLELIKEARKKIIIAKFMQSEVEDRAVVSEEDSKRFYELHKDELKTPEIFRASHILVPTEADASAALDALSKGASFEELARTRSIDPTASRGGDIGYFRAGQLIADFEKVCTKLEVGQLSGVVHTQFGYHIIKLTERNPPGIESYENAKAAIEAQLKKGKRRVVFEEMLADLKNKYGVEIHEAVLKSLEVPGAASPEEKL